MPRDFLLNKDSGLPGRLWGLDRGARATLMRRLPYCTMRGAS